MPCKGRLYPISIHTPHAGSDFGIDRIGPAEDDFNPHSPCGERLVCHQFGKAARRFQSTLPMRGATGRTTHTYRKPSVFQSTLPMRGATITSGIPRADVVHFNPHSPCGERRKCREYVSKLGPISIHTPHAGSDSLLPAIIAIALNFNPHSPCGERRQKSIVKQLASS